MAKRRSNGEGSRVHQITPGRKGDGTLIRKSFKGRTKVICTQRREEWLAELDDARQRYVNDWNCILQTHL